MRRATLAVLLTALAGCVDSLGEEPSELALDHPSPGPVCDGLDLCRPCDPHDFDLQPDGTNRCPFVLSHQPVALMGEEPIAYQGGDTYETWAVTGVNPDQSPIITTSTLTGAAAFVARHRVTAWDDYVRDPDVDPPISEWAFEASRDDAHTARPMTAATDTATGASAGNPVAPVVRCGDTDLTVSVTWPHGEPDVITDCDCERILRETARRYAEYYQLDRHTITVRSQRYEPWQYLRDDWAFFAPPPNRRVVPKGLVPNAPVIAHDAGVYTISLHTAQPQDIKSDAKIFRPTKAIVGFRAYQHNRESMVRAQKAFVALAANADAPRDSKNRIIYKLDADVIVGSGPLAGVMATHLPDAVIIDDGEKRHLHRNNTRLIQDRADVSWARYLGAGKPKDFVEPRDMVEGDAAPLRHVHIGLAAEQLMNDRTIIPGKIKRVEHADGEAHLELKVDGIDALFVIHIKSTRRAWILTGPPESDAATYEVDATVPVATGPKLAAAGLDTKAGVEAFIHGKIFTNNEWYDLPHERIRARVNGKHVFVFGTGGGALQALGQITDGNGGDGEVAKAKKVTVASFHGGIEAAGVDPATQSGGGQAAAYRALRRLAKIPDDDTTNHNPRDGSTVIYGARDARPGFEKKQPRIVIDNVSVAFHDPGDGSGERPMLKFLIKRPGPPGGNALDDVVVYADEAIWSMIGPGKTELELDAPVVRSFKLAMDGDVPLGATAAGDRVRFVAANSTVGILDTIAGIDGVAPTAGTGNKLKETYQKALAALNDAEVNGIRTDRNSKNAGTLNNQLRYLPLFARWSP